MKCRTYRTCEQKYRRWYGARRRSKGCLYSIRRASRGRVHSVNMTCSISYIGIATGIRNRPLHAAQISPRKPHIGLEVPVTLILLSDRTKGRDRQQRPTERAFQHGRHTTCKTRQT
ncbi:hypothetical protein PYCCODRAFT_954408 [Trametes coccinea BRFM310]|uniref:Uncharacterized protein n=1 Tax=Trametes coccinea (strain BRFM310) TaxID=1353009 RepID=A0A1Y2J1E0_TRAC3|nr:hypothetical protein PYCCODRAFT_954408 [Trametes coccinea BRFM310]